MSESKAVSVGTFLVLGLLLGGAAVAGTLRGHVGPEKRWEEVFAASVDVIMEAIVAGGVLWWYERRQARREQREAIARDVRAVRTRVQSAAFLMRAHRSGGTWTQQMRALIEADAELEEVEHELRRVPNGALAEEVKGYLGRTRDALRDLRHEYGKEHQRVDRLQLVHEHQKKAGPETGKWPDPEQHWSELIEPLAKTQHLVLDVNSTLLDTLRCAADALAPNKR